MKMQQDTPQTTLFERLRALFAQDPLMCVHLHAHMRKPRCHICTYNVR